MGKPKIIIDIDEHGMNADLKIIPDDNPSAELPAESILESLKKKGIEIEPDKKSIEEVVSNYKNEPKYYEYSGFVTGTPPGKAPPPTLKSSATLINNSQNLEYAQKCRYAYEVEEKGIRFDIVKKEGVIAEKDFSNSGNPGKNLFGEAIPPETEEDLEIKTDENVEISEQGYAFKAILAGIPYYVDGKIGVITLDLRWITEVKVSDDNMKAEIIIHKGYDDSPPDEDVILNKLKEKEINYGIDTETIKETVKKISMGKSPTSPVKVAQGNPPVKGKDGYVKYYIKTDTSVKPARLEDGSVDFKNVSMFIPVKKGQKLAELIPPEQGKTGYDIFSKGIEADNGSSAALPAGSNTETNNENPNILIASADGNASYNGKEVSVSEALVIEGDVDYHSGNIDYIKSVVINGDVKSGFSVNCGKDLEIQGSVEDAEVNAKNNVLIKRGFSGQKHGSIDCGGDIGITFVNNQKIRAHGNITISKEAINSDLWARDAVEIEGKHLSAAGGVIRAYNKISGSTFGNNNGTPTFLEVGCDFILIEDLEKTKEELKKTEENKKKINESSVKLEHMAKIKKDLPPKQKELYKKVKASLQKHDNQIKLLNEKIERLKEKIETVDHASIHVEKAIMPGVNIKIGKRHHAVKDKITGPKTIKMVDFEIKIF